MFNTNSNIQYNKLPFPHIIIENFFTDNFYSELEKYFPKSDKFLENENKVGRMHGDTTFGDTLYNNLLNNSKAYNSLHNWVYSDNFIKFFINFFENEFQYQDDLLYNPKEFDLVSKPVEIGSVFNNYNFEKQKVKPYVYSRLDIGYGGKNYGVDTGGRGPHIDNPQRIISILFYVGGFKKITGGQHRLYKISTKKNELEVYKTYEPKRNSLIASLQNNFAFHDVNPITDIDGQRNAFYLAISSSKRIWRPSVRNYINKKFNKNRVESSFLNKLLNIFS
jgi:hypothetical protein